jgi:hypothetical protein
VRARAETPALVYGRTGSPLLTALAYLGGLLLYALGAMTLLSYADRVPPRGFLAAWDAVRVAVTLALAAGVLPIWAMIGLVMATGTGQSLAAAVRNAVLVDILPDGRTHAVFWVTGEAEWWLNRSVFDLIKAS